MTNIYRADFDAAIDMLTTLRDRALTLETEMRADDSLADFDDALGVVLECATDDYSPDALETMLAFIHATDR